MNWILYASISALAAAATAILAKIGVRDISSNLATAIRTVVIMAFVWGLVVARGELVNIKDLRGRTVLFLILSALATAVSWLAYYRALQLAPASRVAPLDKLSLPLTILLAAVFLGEPLTWKLAVGATLMVIGALITVSA
jgi:bacterial/archaeal transporter family protein